MLKGIIGHTPPSGITYYDDNFSSNSCTSQLSFSGTGSAATSTDVHVTGSSYSCKLTSAVMVPPNAVNFGPELDYTFASGIANDPQFGQLTHNTYNGLWTHVKMAIPQATADALWVSNTGPLCGFKVPTEHRPSAGAGPGTGYGWSFQSLSCDNSAGHFYTSDDGSTNSNTFLCSHSGDYCPGSPSAWTATNYVSPGVPTSGYLILDFDEWQCKSLNTNDCFSGSVAGVAYYKQWWNGTKKIDVNDSGAGPGHGANALGPTDTTHPYTAKHGMITIQTDDFTVSTVAIYLLHLQAWNYNSRSLTM